MPGAAALVVFDGDSITFGSGSTSLIRSAGQRFLFREWCDHERYNVDLIGSSSFGTFTDNEHEGHGGQTIAGIAGTFAGLYGPGLTYTAADLILCMAGTNNMDQVAAYDGTTTPAAYAALLASYIAAFPNVRIAVTTILAIDPTLYPTSAADVTDYNSKLPAIWDAFDVAHPSNKLFRWNANLAVGAYSTTKYFDFAHPNDYGYIAMINHPTHGLKAAAVAGGGQTLAAFLAGFPVT